MNDMLLSVNDQIRQAVRIELAKRDMKQAKLAEDTGMSTQYISELMKGKVNVVPKSWQKIFDQLDLELVARPKKAN